MATDRVRRLSNLLILLAGCSRGGEPAVEPRYDDEQARVALVAALDAWKTGEARSLPQCKPPIRFVDEDFASGLRLTEYEIEEPDAPISLHKDVAVILSLLSP